MNPTRRHIDDIFAAVRPVQPKEPLCSADELRSIIGSPAAVGKSRSFTRFFTAGRAVAAALLVASIATGVFFASRSTAPRDQAVVPKQTIPSGSPVVLQTVPAAETPVAAPVETPAAEIRASLPVRAVKQVSEMVESTRPTLASPLKIRGLRFLELSDKELAQLGITRTPHGYELAAQEIVRYDDQETRRHLSYTRNNGDNVSLEFHKSRFKEFYSLYFGGDTTEPIATLTYKISLDTFSTACQPVRYPVANTVRPAVSPLIISQDYYRNPGEEGRLVVTFENPLLLDSISKFSRQVFEMYTSLAPDSASECRDITKYSLLSKLVPVRIRMGAERKHSVRTAGSDIILWYYPSREFIDALPQELANRLRIELGFTTLVEEGVLHAEELKKRYCGEYNYLDVCRTKDGAVSISSIVPNPAADRAMVKVHVTERRNFTISLHDMSGNRVAHLTNLQLADSDVVTIDVSDKPAGTYLIAVTSDKGEQVVERLIVSR